MDSVLTALFSWQFIFLCLAIAAVMQVLRLVAEYVMDLRNEKLKETKLWRDLVLVVTPIFLGLFAGLVFENYAWPDGITSNSARGAVGLVAGLTSGLFFRLYKAFLSSKVSEFTSKITGKTAKTDDPGAEVRDTINKE